MLSVVQLRIVFKQFMKQPSRGLSCAKCIRDFRSYIIYQTRSIYETIKGLFMWNASVSISHGAIVETTRASNFKIYEHLALDSLFILSQNDVTSYSRSTVNRINVLDLGHVQVEILADNVQPISNRLTVFGKGDSCAPPLAAQPSIWPGYHDKRCKLSRSQLVISFRRHMIKSLVLLGLE